MHTAYIGIITRYVFVVGTFREKERKMGDKQAGKKALEKSKCAWDSFVLKEKERERKRFKCLIHGDKLINVECELQSESDMDETRGILSLINQQTIGRLFQRDT